LASDRMIRRFSRTAVTKKKGTCGTTPKAPPHLDGTGLSQIDISGGTDPSSGS